MELVALQLDNDSLGWIGEVRTCNQYAAAAYLVLHDGKRQTAFPQDAKKPGLEHALRRRAGAIGRELPHQSARETQFVEPDQPPVQRLIDELFEDACRDDPRQVLERSLD